MRDAVADLIASREALDPPLGRFVAMSALVHAALAAFLLVGQLVTPQPEKRKVISVRLSSGGGVMTAPAQPVAETPRSSAAVEKAPAPPQPPPDATPLPMTRPAPPAQETTKPPTAKTSAGETLFGRSDRPAAEKPVPTTRPAPAAAVKGSGSAETAPGSSATAAQPALGTPGVGKAGVLSLEGGPFPFSDYLERMIGLVGRRWQRPALGTDPSATIYFIIDRDGRIRDARVEESSGVGSFDRAALRAVLESSPLPPLPAGYSGNWLGVHLAFH